MNNPFETYPNTFAEIYRKRHKCETVMLYTDDDLEASGEAKLNAEKKEHWVNEACAEGWCEYCHGWQYNEWFQEKPTNEDVNELIMNQQLKCDLAKKVKRKKYMEKFNGEDKNNGQLITLCIDKDYKQVPKLAEEIISVIKETQYKDIIDGYAVIEVTGDDMEWNPHIHCVTKKVGKAGALAQVLRRKFINEKYQIYRVHIEPVKYERGLTYMEGDKIDDKLPQVEADKKYRNDNKLKRLYNLSP